MTVSMPTPTQSERRRNPRGEGGRLKAEILDAAAELLEAGETLSLRSIARAADIAAPSIYRHFPDLDTLMAALAEGFFDALAVELRRRGDEADTAGERLRRICATYLEYAREHPHRYRLMFGDVWDATAALAIHPEDDARFRRLGSSAHDLLVDAVERCAAEGASGSLDPRLDATALWVGLHGYAQLRQTAKLFPWPPHLEDTMITTLARLRPPA